MPPEKIGLAAVLDMDDFNKGLKQYDKGLAGMGKRTLKAGKGLTKAFVGVGKAVGKTMVAGIGLATIAVGAMGAAMFKLAADAAPLAGVRAAFKGITEASGMAADEILAALVTSSSGMITNADAMKAYNSAAQLVGVTFANTLPEAMGFLSKVSAATGEDMGFMMDSLVKGVGRLSPMILDNLGIQVDLTQAYKDYADEMGIAVAEMTKTEQQTALMNQVMELLATNTAAMPEVTGTAAAATAAFGVQMTNLKDEIGLALVPALGTLMEGLGELAAEHLPPLVAAFEEHVVPAIEVAVKWLADNLPRAIITAQNAFGWIVNVIGQFKRGFVTAIDTAREWWGKFTDAMKTVWDYLEQSIFPALTTVYNWLKERIPEAIGVVQGWWENTLKGALKTVWDYLTGDVFTAFETAYNWLKEKIPAAIEEVRKWWEETFLTALQTVRDYVVDEVVPKIEELAALFEERFTKATEDISVLWEETLQPAMKTVWTFLTEDLIPTLDELVTQLNTDVTKATSNLATLWKETLQPPLVEVWRVISEDVYPIFEALANLWKTVIGLELKILTALWDKLFGKLAKDVNPVLDRMFKILRDDLGKKIEWVSGLLGGLYTTLSNIWTIISTKVVKVIQDLTTTLANMKLPKWLQSGSPSPFENTLTRIALLLSVDLPNAIDVLSRAFGTRMRKMFVDAKDIRGELEELFTIGGVFGGLGGAAASMLQQGVLTPLQAAYDTETAIIERLMEERAALAEEREKLLSTGDTGPGTFYADFEILRQQERISEALTASMDRRAELGKEIAEHEERIAALQEKQAQLGFLQQQVDLLKLIEQYDLNLEDIMGGMALGVEANMADVLDAMVRAMTEVVNVVEEELGISSPSRVFEALGQQAMAGFMAGIQDVAAVPVGALMQGAARAASPSFAAPSMSMPATTQISNAVNLNMGGVQIYDRMDAASFEAYVRQIVNNDIG